MRILGGLGVMLIGWAVFPVWGARQALFQLGLVLLCIVFDHLIEHAGRARE